LNLAKEEVAALQKAYDEANAVETVEEAPAVDESTTETLESSDESTSVDTEANEPSVDSDTTDTKEA
jgi:hypothetical protein